MAIKPILFNGPMVRAILAGEKTQTRRPIKFPAGFEPGSRAGVITGDGGKIYHLFNDYDRPIQQRIRAPYHPGDVLWVRETWRKFNSTDECGCSDFPCNCPPNGYPLYRADQDDGESRWTPSIHMPKWACRIFLRVARVWPEFLYDITTDGYMAEGAYWGPGLDHEPEDIWGHISANEDWFRELWDSINAKRGAAWEDHPWVWVIEFERCERPRGWPND